jgi:hypothetical protein
MKDPLFILQARICIMQGMKHVRRYACKLIHAELITVHFGIAWHYAYVLKRYVSPSPIDDNITTRSCDALNVNTKQRHKSKRENPSLTEANAWIQRLHPCYTKPNGLLGYRTSQFIAYVIRNDFQGA